MDRTTPPEAPSTTLVASLWTAQAILFLVFAGGAVWKVATPLGEIAAKMSWVGEVPPTFFYTTAGLDFLGGLGLLLPAVSRLRPALTGLAAMGSSLLMVGAIVFHFSRGEAASTPFNFLLIALCAFVYWGRRFRAPILERA
jgi:hypothetical protein